jgi:hypothetical protein
MFSKRRHLVGDKYKVIAIMGDQRELKLAESTCSSVLCSMRKPSISEKTLNALTLVAVKISHASSTLKST